MSEIPFVNQLGDALDVMIANQPRARSIRWRLPRVTGHSRLTAVVAVVLIGGGAAAAATVLSGKTTALVARGLSCNHGTPRNTGSQAFDVDQNGLSPVAVCAGIMGIPASKLVVCTSQRFGVNVYIRDQTARAECGQAGMAVGVPAGFAQATASVATLAHDLNRLYASRNCFTVSGLAAGTESILRTLGYVGWHVRDMSTKSVPTTGPCGQFLASGGSWSDAAGSLNGSQRQVMIDQGASRDTMLAFAKVSVDVFKAPPTASARCTITGVESYVTKTLRAAGLKGPILFAAFSEPKGMLMENNDNRQARYNAGCPVYVDSETAPDGRTLLIELWQRNRPRLPAGDVPPESAYKRSIKP